MLEDKSSEPTKEQIKEFWEWCGFKKAEANSGWKDGVYKYPFDGTGHGIVDQSYAFLPDIDLNNLDKYALPRVLDKYDIKIFSFYDDLNNKVFWFVHIIDRNTGEVEFANIEGELELRLAVFWTVRDMMEAEVNK